jgi:hypothetical protein
MTLHRRSLIAAGGLGIGVIAATAPAIVPQLLWGDHADYSNVVSIRSAASFQQPALLEKAWALPVASRYRPHFEFQSNPSFCGPASLVNILRSRGRMRLRQADLLDKRGLFNLFGMIPGGLSLDELAGLARRHFTQATVSTLRDLNAASFREHLHGCNDPSRRYIANFSRGPLFGKGSGHHSPLAGYLRNEDLVLVLDVNRAFGPWLVDADRLLGAMRTVDPTTQRPRGLLLIECAPPVCADDKPSH